MKDIKPELEPALVLETIETALCGQSHTVFPGGNGSTITLALVRSQLGWAMPFKYCLVFEIPRADCSVFYIAAAGEVCWAAGPKRYSFAVVWRMLLARLSQDIAPLCGGDVGDWPHD